MRLRFIFFYTNPKLEKFDYTFTFVQVILKLIDFRNVVTFSSLGMSQFISSNLLTCSCSLFKYSVKLRSEFHCLRNVGRKVYIQYIYSSTKRDYYTIRRLDGAISTWTFRYFLAFVSTSVLYLTMHLSAFLRSNKINPGNYSRLFIYYHLLLLINQEDNRFQIFNFFLLDKINFIN